MADTEADLIRFDYCDCSNKRRLITWEAGALGEGQKTVEALWACPDCHLVVFKREEPKDE